MAKGEGQAISTLSASGADLGYDNAGERTRPLTFEKVEVSAYLEYGLTEKVTLVARPALQDVRLRDVDGAISATGLSATEVAVRRVISQAGGRVVSGQLGAFLPGEGENGLDDRFGDGAVGLEGRVLAGRGWSPLDAAGLGRRFGLNGFAEAQAAARGFANDKPPEARLDLTLGVRPRPGRLLLGQTFSVWSEGDRDRGVRPYAHHRLQLSSVRNIGPRLGLQAGVHATLDGRNVVADDSAFVALWWRY